MLTRRVFLSSAAACGLAGCASVVTPVPGGGSLPIDFIDQVIAIVRAGCGIYTGYAPTVTSIAQVVSAMFGAAALATVSAIAGAVNAVASALCAAAAPAPAAMRFNGRSIRARGSRPSTLAQRLAVSSPSNPVVIGKISVGGVPITVMGYQ
jgi:hypothetical protein